MSKSSILKLKNMLESEKIPYDFNIYKCEDGLEYYYLAIMPDLEPEISWVRHSLMLLSADNGYDPYCSDDDFCEIKMSNVDYAMHFFGKIKTYGEGFYWNDYISIYDAFEIAKNVLKELAEQ